MHHIMSTFTGMDKIQVEILPGVGLGKLRFGMNQIVKLWYPAALAGRLSYCT